MYHRFWNWFDYEFYEFLWLLWILNLQWFDYFRRLFQEVTLPQKKEKVFQTKLFPRTWMIL